MLASPIEEIKDRLDIVQVVGSYIKLQKAGSNYRAVCPFHTEKKPSFFVNPARQIWHCFGSCGTGGDIFKFVMMIEGVEFGDALRILAQKAGVELKREDPKIKTQRQNLYEISELSCRFFEKQLQGSSAGLEAKKYLLSRGLKEQTIKKWRLGYSPDSWEGLVNFLISSGYKKEDIEKSGLAVKSQKNQNYYDRFRARIMFPIFDLNSQIVGFGGRTLKKEETAKYVNTPATLLYDKSRVLYGLNNAGQAVRKSNKCILVEGYMDVLMVSQAGFENVVATSGTALTPFQLKTLKRYSDNLYTAFDMDIAGSSATQRGVDLAQQQGFDIKIISMEQGKDPADIILQSPNAFGEFIDKAKSIRDFYFENAALKFDKDTLEGKKGISKIILPVIKKIPNKIEQNVWTKDLAQVLCVREEDVLHELKKTKLDNLDFIQEPEQKKNIKTRKEMLEEKIIALFSCIPDKENLINQEDLKFFSLPAVNIIDYLKNKNVPDKDMEDKIKTLSFKTEIEEAGIDFRAELGCCFKELKSLFLRDKLTDICQKIRTAEEQKDSNQVQDLVQQFCHYSKSRNDLEKQTS